MSSKDQTGLPIKHAGEKAALTKEHAKQLSALKEYLTAKKQHSVEDYNNKKISQYADVVDTLQSM